MIERLGIIGDLHGEHERLDASLSWLTGQRLDALVCTGDIADGRGCINQSCEMLRQANVQTVAGNHDRWLLQGKVRHLDDAHQLSELSVENAEYISALPRWQALDTVRGPVLLCHGVQDNDMAKVWPGRPGRPAREIERSAELDTLLEDGEYRFVINGHMHFRVLIDFPDLLLLNAGTLKGDHPGVTVMDFRERSITAYGISDNAAPDRLLEQHMNPGSARRVWRNTEDFDGSAPPVTLYANTR